MLKKLFIICILSVLSTSYATPPTAITVNLQPGTLSLGQFLDQCPAVATSKPSPFAHSDIPGKQVQIQGNHYEIRVFSFEDPTGQLSPDMTFQDYAKKNNLLTMTSMATHPKPGLDFESFDCRMSPASSHDPVYFHLSLKKHPEKESPSK